jgi:hypothetical protein
VQFVGRAVADAELRLAITRETKKYCIPSELTVRIRKLCTLRLKMTAPLICVAGVSRAKKTVVLLA